MSKEKTTQYRAVASRGSYLGADRSDVQYASKEKCRDMSVPSEASRKRFRRIARFLKNSHFWCGAMIFCGNLLV